MLVTERSLRRLIREMLEEEDVYVYVAVPPSSVESIMKIGMLNAVEVMNDEELLMMARPNEEDRLKFIEKVNEDPNDESVNGISVFFVEPDWSKITEKHYIKKWGLVMMRINLSAFLRDYPGSYVLGVELLPIIAGTDDMSDEEYDEYLMDLGYEWEGDLGDARKREISLEEIKEYESQSPEEMWKWYDEEKHAGKYYAANVPHAFIMSEIGKIPPEYIERVLYHGSPYKFDVFEPKGHILAQGKKVTFATPLKSIALASLCKWSDKDFEQGIVDDDPPYMIEMYPGAFEKVYRGKRGYLYEIAGKDFSYEDNLTRFELISEEIPDIIKRVEIYDVLEELYKSDMQLIRYEDGEEFRNNDYMII